MRICRVLAMNLGRWEDYRKAFKRLADRDEA